MNASRTTSIASGDFEARVAVQPARNSASGSGKIWAWIPVLLLAGMLLGLGTMARIAIDDPNFALEPNYYDKAVHWDRSRAEARASDDLGLQLTLLRQPVTSLRGDVELVVGMRDRHGHAIEGAELQLAAFPNAYATRIQHATLREVSPGVYHAKLERGVPGLWELRFSALHGTTPFYQVLRADVGAGGAP